MMFQEKQKAVRGVKKQETHGCIYGNALFADILAVATPQRISTRENTLKRLVIP